MTSASACVTNDMAADMAAGLAPLLSNSRAGGVLGCIEEFVFGLGGCVGGTCFPEHMVQRLCNTVALARPWVWFGCIVLCRSMFACIRKEAVGDVHQYRATSRHMGGLTVGQGE